LEAKKLLFKPYPKQDEFLEACNSGKYTVLTYGGAMGGGKSFVAIAYLIFLCKVYPNSKWCVIRDSVPTMKKTALETFKKLCPMNFLQNFNQNDLTATFTNGSRIIFMAEDYQNDKDFDRFKGLEVNGFLLEQIEELQEGLLDVCLIRAGRWRIDPMPKPIILATVNPTQNWVKTRIFEAYRKGTLPDDWYYLPATIVDNQELSSDPDYMKNLSRLDPLTYRRYVLGDWDAFEVKAPFFYAFKEEKHVKPVTYNPMLEVMLSFDFNCDPITCIGAQEDAEGLKIFKEWRIMGSDIYTLTAQIKADMPHALFLVTGDATGANRSALTKGNINYYTVIENTLDLAPAQMRQLTVNSSHADSYILCNSILQNMPFAVSDECPHMIYDLKNVQIEYKEEKMVILKDRKDKTREADLADCLRYLFATFYGDFVRFNI
jgi:hypothetical protein